MKTRCLSKKKMSFALLTFFLVVPFFVFTLLSLVGCESETPKKKPQLSDFAVVKGKTVYPNGVDKTLLGAYEYDLKDPQQMVLAVVEGMNTQDHKLMSMLAGYEVSAKEFSRFERNFIKNYEIVEMSDDEGAILTADVEYEGNIVKASMAIYWNKADDGNLILKGSRLDI